MITLPARAGRHCYAAVNPVHSAIYFSPDLGREFARSGLDDKGAAYFAARAAPMGRVGAGTVTATFYNFSHRTVARHVPGLWDTVTPEEALATRLRAVDSLLRRLLGEEAVASRELAEAAELALRATEGCSRPARPLYAANADLPVPEAPHLAYWHAATILREHRGDGHLTALVHHGLDAVEALVSHSATGKGMASEWARTSRGWTSGEWTAAQDRLRERGLLDAGGVLTASGTQLRRDLEEETDRLDLGPYEHLGAAGTARLTELAAAFSQAALKAGAFPSDVIGKR
ncbi:hypothetical protein [Streptomyces sp. NPDC088725]|uniref:SCO6745 family protein n=1 Tax=Streptomyces sp. NPDC088725 TaxID=3365873 RepID=UPI00380951B9